MEKLFLGLRHLGKVGHDLAYFSTKVFCALVSVDDRERHVHVVHTGLVGELGLVARENYRQNMTVWDGLADLGGGIPKPVAVRNLVKNSLSVGPPSFFILVFDMIVESMEEKKKIVFFFLRKTTPKECGEI